MQVIKEEYKHNFQVSKTGLFSISISARCKSGEQTGIAGGEDLRVEIDDKKLREVPPKDKPRYKDIPSAWNGAKLKGLKKTIIFILWLNKGEHNLKFIPEQGAVIEEEPKIKFIENPNKMVFNLEEQAEDGDCRPWITFALVDLPLKSLIAKVTVKGRWRDSDDVKLIIDNEIQKNKFSLFHRYWLWSGSIFKKFFQKETQTKTINTNLDSGLHYIEFWADKIPVLHKVELVIPPLRGRIVLCQDIEETNFVNFRDNPNTDENTKILDKLKDGEEIEILEERVIGEWILFKSCIWHKVKYKNQTGYILSSFVEIEGQERKIVIEKIKQKANELGIDENLVLALAGCESRYKPYACSRPSNEKDKEGFETAAKGVFQLTERLIVDLNDSGQPFYSPVGDPFNIEQNIRAGIKYFKWLYDERYKNDKDRLKKSIAAYNTGPYDVSIEESLNLELYDEQTQRLVKCVTVNSKEKKWKYILFGVIFITLFGITGIWGLNKLNQTDFFESAVSKAEHTMSQISHFPNIIWEEETDQIIFLNSQGKIVKKISVERLGLNKIFQIPEDIYKQEWFTIHGGDVVESPGNVFYFLVANTYTCGAQNCTWALYKFDVKKNDLLNIKYDITGISPDMYLSPDKSRIAVVSYFHSTVCSGGSFIDIIDLDTLGNRAVNGFSDKEYTATYIKSLKWLSGSEIVFSTIQGGCGYSGSWEKDFKYDIDSREIDLLRQKFAPGGG